MLPDPLLRSPRLLHACAGPSASSSRGAARRVALAPVHPHVTNDVFLDSHAGRPALVAWRNVSQELDVRVGSHITGSPRVLASDPM